MKFLSLPAMAMVLLTGCFESSEPSAPASPVSSVPQETETVAPPRPLLGSWVTPLPQGNSFLDLRYLSSRFVAVGTYGAVMTSVNGIDWTWLPNQIHSNLRGIAYGAGTFVAIGPEPEIFLSEDLRNWTTVSNGNVAGLQSIVHGDSCFVAVGSAGRILRSTDGRSWTPAKSPTTKNLDNVVFINQQFLAAGENGTLLASLDGLTWKAIPVPTTNHLKGIAYGDSTLVVLGTQDVLLTSTKGGPLVLSNQNFTSAIDVVYSDLDSSFYFMRYGTISKWRPGGIPARLFDSGPEYSAMAIAGGRVVLSGYHGFLTYFNVLNPDFSRLGTRQFPSDHYWSLAYGKGKFAGVTSKGVLSSSDGVGWGVDTSNPDMVQQAKVKFGNGLFVAVGRQKPICYSEDGTTWIAATAPTSLNDVAMGSGKFIAVGDSGLVMISTDGKNWSRTRIEGDRALSSIAYGDSLFVARGYGERIYTSVDGQSWSVRTSGRDQGTAAITYGNGRFVSVGASTILYSLNGLDWKHSNYRNVDYFQDVAFAEGQFVAVGGAGFTGTRGSVLHSLDGIDWFAVPPMTNEDFTSVLYANQRFYLTTASGSILTYRVEP